MQKNPRENPQVDCYVAYCYPGFTPEKLDNSTQGEKCIVIIGYASGIVPNDFAPVVEKRIKEGAAVFIISNNRGDEHGATAVKYDAGQAVLEAGAVLLQKANIRHLDQVLDEIRQAQSMGLSGVELAKYMQTIFCYGKDEDIPLAEWDTFEGIVRVRKFTEASLRDLSTNQGGQKK